MLFEGFCSGGRGDAVAIAPCDWAPGSCKDHAVAGLSMGGQHVKPSVSGTSVELTISSAGSTAVVLDIVRSGRPALVNLVVERNTEGGVYLSIHRVSELSAASSKQLVMATKASELPPPASLDACPQTDVHRRLDGLAYKMGLTSARLVRVPSDYYERELEWRRDVLEAQSTKQASHLCRRIALEMIDPHPTRSAALQIDGHGEYPARRGGGRPLQVRLRGVAV